MSIVEEAIKELGVTEDVSNNIDSDGRIAEYNYDTKEN